MSRLDRNKKKSGTFGSTPEPRRAGGIYEHHCVTCGRWGAFGVAEDGRNGHQDWYCRDHLPLDRFTTMEKTFVRQFEEVFLGIKSDGGSQPTEEENPREG